MNKVFEEARDLQANECAGIFDRACGGDEMLRREVESLTEHYAMASRGFL